jgi:DNA-directed RNA polymerase specialized sigma24 family protein
MDDTAMKEFFTRPTQTYHRQYEALRAVFVDGRSQKEVAEAFGYEYDAFRQLIHRFRQSRDASPESNESPFFETSM